MIAVGLVTLLLGAELQPTPPPFDPACFDPGIVEVAAACEQGDHPADVCVWIALLEAALGGDAVAVEVGLVEVFGVSPEIASKSAGPLQFMFSPLLVRSNDECFLVQLQRMRAMVSGPERSVPLQDVEGVVVMMPLFGFPEGVLEIVRSGLGAERADSVLRAGEALVALLDLSGHGATIRDMLPSGLVPNDWQTALPSMVDDLPAEDRRELERVTEILELVMAGRSVEARHAVERLIEEIESPALEARLLVRCGLVLQILGALEDAEIVLRRAERTLASATDVEGRLLAAVVARTRAVNLFELGLVEEAERIRLRLASAEPPIPILLGAMGGVPGLSSRGLEHSQVDFGSMLDLLLNFDPVADRELAEAMMRVFQTLTVWHSPSADGQGGYGRALLVAMGHLGRGDFDAFAATLDQILVEYPRYDSLGLSLHAGVALLQRGDHERALALALRALDHLEAQASANRVGEVTSAFLHRTTYRFYWFGVAVAIEAKRYDAAFSIAERGRAFVLRRQLGASRVRGDGRTSRAEHELEEQIVAGVRAGTLSGDLRARVFREFRAARLERLLSNAPVTSPPIPEPVEVETLQGILDDAETLVATFTALDRLWIWVVRPDGTSFGDGLWTGAEVEAFERSLAAVRWPAEGDPSSDPGRELYDRLIAPLADVLPASGRLILVPHGVLHRVPWPALRAPDGRRLVESHELVVAPSADIFMQLRGDRREAAPTTAEVSASTPSTALVLGDPETHLSVLSAARAEAAAVADFLEVEPLLGEGATEAAVRARAGDASILHIAAHGVYEPDHPLFSRLQLARGGDHDGFLHVHEIWDSLDLPKVRLVVLSACDTAAGEPTRGDDIVGLTQAFLVAGAPAVISTLWPVDDPASAALMVSFYERFVQQGATAGEALRGAQLELQADERYAAPYYWAGFVLVGDPSVRFEVDADAENRAVATAAP